jgi:predicted PurR-regulated permease PerM
MVAVLTALVYLILPQLYSSIETIVKNGPDYLRDLSAWVTGLLDNHPEITKYVQEALNSLNTDIMSWVSNKLLPGVGNLVTSLIEGGYVVVQGVYNLLIGIIVSIYLLSDLEHFTAALRRLNYSLFSLETAEKVREAVSFTDRTFMGFISGKLLDSAIIGLICYIVCAILNMPYALLVSVIVGVTNIIPFFGPLIGAIPATIIILMVSPLKAFIFVVFVIILQQVDGNFIGPKILGNSVGISGFWVMFSIIVGAGLFGFWGMLLGVPVFVVIYTFIKEGVEKRLRRSELPLAPEDYVDLEYIDPITLQPVRSEREDGAEE